MRLYYAVTRVTPFRTPAPLWGRTTQIPRHLSPIVPKMIPGILRSLKGLRGRAEPLYMHYAADPKACHVGVVPFWRERFQNDGGGGGLDQNRRDFVLVSQGGIFFARMYTCFHPRRIGCSTYVFLLLITKAEILGEGQRALHARSLKTRGCTSAVVCVPVYTHTHNTCNLLRPHPPARQRNTRENVAQAQMDAVQAMRAHTPAHTAHTPVNTFGEENGARTYMHTHEQAGARRHHALTPTATVVKARNTHLARVQHTHTLVHTTSAKKNSAHTLHIYDANNRCARTRTPRASHASNAQ